MASNIGTTELAIPSDDLSVPIIQDICPVAQSGLDLSFGIGFSKNKTEALKTVSQCPCIDCQAVTILLHNKLENNKLENKCRDFSDQEFEFAKLHAQDSNCGKLLLAIIFSQRFCQEKAIILFKELADKDLAVACLFLAKLLILRDEVEYYLKKAHESKAYTATLRLGKLSFDYHETKAKNALAYAFFEEVEKTFFPHAFCKLAEWHKQSNGPQNPKEVVRFYSLAAKQGDPEACYKYGCIFRKGKYVTEDITQAKKYFCLAADSGHKDAQAELGYMYLNGDGVTKDEEKARSLLTLAAEQGNLRAQMMLSTFRS
jgi:TPR repeat protein